MSFIGRPGRAARRRLRRGALSLAVAAGLPCISGQPVLGADTTPSLGFAVPQEAIAYFHAEASDGWGGLGETLSRFSRRLGEVRFFEPLVEAALAPSFSDDQQEAFRAEVEALHGLLGSIPWTELLRREVAFAARFEYPLFELLALFRIDAERGERTVEKLRELFEVIAAQGDGLEIEVRTTSDGTSMVIRSALEPQAELCFARRDDVIALSTSTRLLRQSFQLLNGRSQGQSILLDETYRKQLSAVHDHGGMGLYLRPANYFAEIDRVIEILSQETGNTQTALAATRRIEELRALKQAFDAFEAMSFHGSLGDASLRGSFRVIEKQDVPERGIHEVYREQEPLGDALASIPEHAETFFAYSGLDLEALWKLLVRALEADGTILGETVRGFDRLRQTRADFSMAAALLDVVSGPVLFHAVPESNGGPGLIARLRVEDGQAARDKLSELAELLANNALFAVEIGEVEGLPFVSLNCPVVESGRLHLAVQGDELLVLDGKSPMVPAKATSGAARAKKLLASLGLDAGGKLTAAAHYDVARVVAWKRRMFQAASAVERLAGAVSGERPTGATVLSRLASAMEAFEALGKAGFVLRRVPTGCEGEWAVTFGEKAEKEAAGEAKTDAAGKPDPSDDSEKGAAGAQGEDADEPERAAVREL